MKIDQILTSNFKFIEQLSKMRSVLFEKGLF